MPSLLTFANCQKKIAKPKMLTDKQAEKSYRKNSLELSTQVSYKEHPIYTTIFGRYELQVLRGPIPFCIRYDYGYDFLPSIL